MDPNQNRSPSQAIPSIFQRNESSIYKYTLFWFLLGFNTSSTDMKVIQNYPSLEIRLYVASNDLNLEPQK